MTGEQPGYIALKIQERIKNHRELSAFVDKKGHSTGEKKLKPQTVGSIKSQAVVLMNLDPSKKREALSLRQSAHRDRVI